MTYDLLVTQWRLVSAYFRFWSRGGWKDDRIVNVSRSFTDHYLVMIGLTVAIHISQTNTTLHTQRMVMTSFPLPLSEQNFAFVFHSIHR